MSDYSDRAAAALDLLQNYARDIESDLGKIRRNRSAWPSMNDYADAQRIPQVPVTGIDQVNHNLRAHYLTKAKRFARDAVAPLPKTPPVTADDKTAIGKVQSLLGSIDALTNHDDAVALVATFES